MGVRRSKQLICLRGRHFRDGHFYFRRWSSIYIYPDNLKARATLWLWTLRDVAILGVGGLLSAFALVQSGLTIPAVLTALYAFLTIRLEDVSIMDFCCRAAAFLLLVPQHFEWRDHRDG